MNKEFTFEDLDFEEDLSRSDKLVEYVLNSPEFNIQSLIMPFHYHNTCWGTAAYILSKLDFDKIKLFTPDLLKWLQDLNWYGANTIFQKLLTFPPDFLGPYVEKAVIEALKTKDNEWIANLSGFTYKKILTEKDFCNKKIFSILKNSENLIWD